ncbi:MAG TPA: N-acetylneuraminate synthase family protein [Candidatus Paceibacterota bacterium]|nr:N-acetylneuraminate synthase family protein [Candidatus Paceibacterota bacterium]
MAAPLSTNLKRLFGLLPKRVKIGTRPVGEGHPVFIIAEIGNNHNGDFNLAMRTIKAAADAGADAVKFQKRDVEALISKEMKEMPYVNERSFGKTYGEHRRNQELTIEDYKKLNDYTENLGMIFFATPHDIASADELESIGVHAYKISSFDITNQPLLIHVAKKDKPILLSTGMSSLEEMDRAIETILSYNNRLIVNHCTSIYPTPDENVDLNMVSVLRKRYAPLPVGYSGHEPDILPTIVSVGMGATTVERHFTLDRTMRGSDHHMSIDPPMFKEMVDGIRRVEKLLGSLEKRIHEGELVVRNKLAKSIVAARDIQKGQRVTADDLVTKIPGSGINPVHLEGIIGRIADSDIPADTMLPESALSWKR